MPDSTSTNPDISRRLAWVALLVILAAGGAVRFWHIGAKELWLDECISALAAEGTLAETAANVATQDAHPPLYYLALNLTTRLVGRGEAGLRVLSAAASLACVVLTYAVGLLLLNRAAALAAAGAMAMSSFQLYFAQEARLYALVELFALGLTYVFLRIVTAPDPSPRRLWPWVALYGALAAASLYTYYYAALVVAAHAAAFAALWLGARFTGGGNHGTALVGQRSSDGGPAEPENGDRHVSARFARSAGASHLFRVPGPDGWLLTPKRADALWPMLLAAAVLGVVLFMLGWGRVFIDRLTAAGAARSAPYGPREAGAALLEFLTGPAAGMIAPRLDRWTELSLGLLPVLPFAAVLCIARRKPGAALLLVLMALVPFAAVAFLNRPHVFEAKHLIFAAPFLFLMLGAGLMRPRTRIPAFVVVALLIGLNAGLSRMYFSPDYHKECWRAVATQLALGGWPGDVVVVTPAPAAFPLNRYYKGRLPVFPADSVEELRAATTQAPKRVWLVELESNVVWPAEGVVQALTTRAGTPVPTFFSRAYEGFATSQTAVRLRCLPYEQGAER